MKFSIAAILLAATSIVSAEEFRVVVGKAENGTAAVCPHFQKKKKESYARVLTPFLH